LKNNSFSKLFEPITRIFQLPNYYELDLTPLIAVFYPIFFAYCLGDAGYGILVILITIIGALTALKGSGGIIRLGLILGIMTTVMGIVKSGSIFGIPLIGTQNIPFFEFLAQYVIIPDDQDYIFNAFNVALMIGVVQILVAVITSIVNKSVYESFKESLPNVGKLLIVTGSIVYFLGDMQENPVFVPFITTSSYAIIAGIVLVLFTHDYSLPVVSRVGSGILPLFFIFTGLLGDTLSYIRLFALGVASSVLGLVVNQIGMNIWDAGWWGVIVAILFLIFGHGLNFVLATLGAFVHPLRLTFVEFYNNAQFKGGGIEYKPFKSFNSTVN
jgi:V/A-type H+-transporting ATPase subunit I